MFFTFLRACTRGGEAWAAAQPVASEAYDRDGPYHNPAARRRVHEGFTLQTSE